MQVNLTRFFNRKNRKFDIIILKIDRDYDEK